MRWYDYKEREVVFSVKIEVDGQELEYEVFEGRIKRDSIPNGMSLYGVSVGDEGDEVFRIAKIIFVNFIYSLVGPRIEKLEDIDRDLWVTDKEAAMPSGDYGWKTEWGRIDET